MTCNQCGGTGRITVSYAAHQAWDPDQGTHAVDEEAREVLCDRCQGSGEMGEDEDNP